MTPANNPAQGGQIEDARLRDLYRTLLDSWNRRDAHAFAVLFEVKGQVISFDGRHINGRTAIQAELNRIFTEHVPAMYVARVREVRFPSPDLAILWAVAGMLPRGQNELDPAAHTIQTVVAVQRKEEWQIALFQHTPAQFRGRPDLVQQMTEELNEALQESRAS